MPRELTERERLCRAEEWATRLKDARDILLEAERADLPRVHLRVEEAGLWLAGVIARLETLAEDQRRGTT